jgi:hypothetical protein
VVGMLLEAGADPVLPTQGGLNALDYAITYGNVACAEAVEVGDVSARLLEEGNGPLKSPPATHRGGTGRTCSTGRAACVMW